MCTPRKSNLDGNQIEKIVLGVNNPIDLLIDIDRKLLFWSDRGTKKLIRSNLDGSQQKTLVQLTHSPHGLALDKKRAYLHFGELDLREIKRIPIDSGKIETVLVSPNPQDRIDGITIDEANGYIYWTGSYFNTIHRANLDGSNIIGIIDVSNGIRFPTGIQVFNSSFIVSTKNLDRTAELKVYPNPFNSSFQVEGLKTGDQLELYDQLGHRSWQQKITLDGTNRIDCQGLPVGIYFLSVIHTNGQISVMKLLKHSNE